jgi:hypothetical protein
MNVEIGAEAAQFPEKEYINGIAVAVCVKHIYELSLDMQKYQRKYKTQKSMETFVLFSVICNMTANFRLDFQAGRGNIWLLGNLSDKKIKCFQMAHYKCTTFNTCQ